MSLSAHDRQALDAIEAKLARSDPHLAAMLSVFSRLAKGEAMPARERVRAREQRTAGAALRALLPARTGTGRPGFAAPHLRCRWSARWAASAWLVMSLVLITIALTLSHSRANAACTGWPVPVCGNHATAHRQSRPQPGLPG